MTLAIEEAGLEAVEMKLRAEAGNSRVPSYSWPKSWLRHRQSEIKIMVNLFQAIESASLQYSNNIG